MKKLPQTLVYIQTCLKHVFFNLSEMDDDGRNNSACSEKIIISNIRTFIKTECIKVPNIRSWYDFLLYDDEYGWIPVNIKITTTTTSDNIGNLACCVQAFTDYKLDLNKNYENGPLSKILIDLFVNKRYNTDPKKDYFCLVINKNHLKNLNNPRIQENDIIINSILSISKFTCNCNNLPFQIKWSKNREPIDIPIIDQIKKFQYMFKTAELPWTAYFINSMKNLHELNQDITISDIFSLSSDNYDNYDYDIITIDIIDDSPDMLDDESL